MSRRSQLNPMWVHLVDAMITLPREWKCHRGTMSGATWPLPPLQKLKRLTKPKERLSVNKTIVDKQTVYGGNRRFKVRGFQGIFYL